MEKAGLQGNMPAVVACGSRQGAYDSFCIAARTGEQALLLVDSEESVNARYQKGEPEEWKPWGHLHQRQGDQWQKPQGTDDLACHLMVQCMETWFLADRASLCHFFGQGFNTNALPSEKSRLESIDKGRIYKALLDASRACKTKGKYGKGPHSFKILEQIDPTKITGASPWARRFVDTARSKMG